MFDWISMYDSYGDEYIYIYIYIHAACVIFEMNVKTPRKKERRDASLLMLHDVLYMLLRGKIRSSLEPSFVNIPQLPAVNRNPEKAGSHSTFITVSYKFPPLSLPLSLSQSKIQFQLASPSLRVS